MPTAFRELLVFNVAARQTSAFQFLNCPGDVWRAAKSSVRIYNGRNIHRSGDVTCQPGNFSQGQQANIRNATGSISQPGAAYVESVEPGLLDLTRNRGI